MKQSTKPFGMVLYTWLPDHNQPNQPGPKYRPVLIIDVNSQTNEILVAYGTSQHTDRCGYGEFVVDMEHLQGLTSNTKFCLNHTRWIPATAEYLSKNGKKRVIGILPKHYFDDLEKAVKEVLGK